MVTVVNSVGKRLRVFSNVRDTSAIPEPARVREPLNMRSSRLSERSAFILCSPMTQRIASTILDLPQPLGPTMPVMGWSNITWVLSAKDLNPLISKDFKRNVLKFCGDSKFRQFARLSRFYYIGNPKCEYLNPKVCRKLKYQCQKCKIAW